jgi:hypothetical protein
MRSFGTPGYLLRHARLEVRLIYTAFLALVLVGMLTMVSFQAYQIGPTPGRIASYYRGGDHGGEMTFPKTFRELVEVTHFHSFIMAIVYLVLAHLFIATTIDARLKLAMISLAFVGLTADLIAPWLIRYVTGGFAYLELAGWGSEWVGFAAFIYFPVREMWLSDGRDELPPE